MSNPLGSNMNPIIIDCSDHDKNDSQKEEYIVSAKRVISTEQDFDATVKRLKSDDENAVHTNAVHTKTTTSAFKLFQTVQDDRSDRMDPSMTECLVTLRQLVGVDGDGKSCVRNFGKGPIEWIVISNYIIDFDYLLDTIPELVSIPTLVFFFQLGDPQKYKTVLPNATFCRLDPSKELRSAENPLRYKFPYGTHHTKMFLVGYKLGIRVVIHTANLIYQDIHLKAQGAFIQDFPLKSKLSPDSCEFEESLVAYMDSYAYQNHHKWSETSSQRISLKDQLACYDFSDAQVKLIPSIPGYYNLPNLCNTQGYLRLQNLIQTYVGTHNGDELGAIVCQFSSIGSLSEKWIRDFMSSLTTNKNLNPISKDSLKLVYPTSEDIRLSIEGYAGGTSVPGTSKNILKPFLKPLYCKWNSSCTHSDASSNSINCYKPRNVPHIKTYYQLSKDKRSFEWFVLGSHNLSKPAWGEIINSRYGKCLKILSWELGVFCCPDLVDSRRIVPYHHNVSDQDYVIPLPYQIDPCPYDSHDKPWAVDGTYDLPDVFGRSRC